MSTLAAANGQRIVVLVNQVDIANRIAHCQDKTKAPIMVSFREGEGAALRIPEQGDKWTAIRRGYIWYLDRKLDTQAEHDDLTQMSPGDGRIAAAKTLHLKVGGAAINDQPFGATVHDIFTTDGVLTTFLLAAPPVHAYTVQPYLNGTYKPPSTYTLSGRTLTFSAAPAAGTLVVYYQRV